MDTKYDAVQHFEFMKKVYDKMPKPNFISDEKGEVDINGVFFYKEYAYTTNGYIIGRLIIKDNAPADNPMFWSYRIEEENEERNIAAKFMLNLRSYCESNNESNMIFNTCFANNLDIFFSKHNDTCFFIRRDHIMNLLNDFYGDKEATKMKTYVNISVTPDYQILFDFMPTKATPTNQPKKKILPMFSEPNRMTNIKFTHHNCCVNVYYLWSIIKHSFPENSIIGIKHNSNYKIPVVLFNKGLDTFWAISQKML